MLLVWGRVFDPAMPSKARLDFRRRRHKAEFHHRESIYYKRREAAFVTESYKVGENCSFAPLGLESFLGISHGLRSFDKLRAGCGLYSCAASRLETAGLVPP